MRKTRMVPGALPSCWKLTLLLCLLWHCCQAYINKCQRQGPQETLAGRTESAATFQRYVFRRFCLEVKVSKFQNELQGFLLCSVAHYWAEILTIFRSYFGRNDDFKNSFWNLMTFRKVWRFLRFIYLHFDCQWQDHRNLRSCPPGSEVVTNRNSWREILHDLYL